MGGGRHARVPRIEPPQAAGHSANDFRSFRGVCRVGLGELGLQFFEFPKDRQIHERVLADMGEGSPCPAKFKES